MSILNRIRLSLKYRLGILQLEEEVESIQYILNNAIDITKIPPTRNPRLRNLQKCNAAILCIVDKLLTKYNLNYWIDYGSLLGAIRHGGFIPWDDDIDISMPRKDYERVFELIRGDLCNFGIEIKPCNAHELRCYVISYKKEITGISIDIFSTDEFKYSEDLNEIKEKIRDNGFKYRDYFWNHLDMSSKELTKYKDKLFNGISSGTKSYLIYNLEGIKTNRRFVIEDKSSIFPLKKIKFEDFCFYAPNNPHALLISEYGANYMQFPKKAFNNHGIDSKELAPVDRATANGIDMENVYNDLMAIYNSL